MAHELWIVKGSTMTNITPILGSLSWKSNKDELGDEISFSLAYNDDIYFPTDVCDLGDISILKNSDYEITRTIIVDENKSGRSPISYTAFDYAFYLNKSDAIYQFNKIPADQAIRKMVNDFNIPVGYIAPMSTLIDKIYNGQKVSEIIKDIISIVEGNTGKKFLMEMREGKFYIEPQSDLIIQGIFDLAENIKGYDVTNAISNPSKKRSIVDMRNSIQIVSGDSLVTELSDNNLIAKYGKLQAVETVDEEQKGNAETIAKNKLAELGKIFEESSIELPGDDRFRAGRLFKVHEPITGLSGTYLITDANHSITNRIHKMSLGLEAV